MVESNFTGCALTGATRSLNFTKSNRCTVEYSGNDLLQVDTPEELARFG
ncbi:MAG: hypothetical protein V7L29_06380 [Nostoc sp.]